MGVHPDSVLAPIRSAQEVVMVGKTESGLPLFCDRSAAESDLLIVLNRVKPHTAFRADIESGVMKMLAVGLGRASSAEAIHRSTLGLARAIVEAARAHLLLPPPKLGVAVVENAYGGIAQVEVLDACVIEPREKQLLATARGLMPVLPFDSLDVLVVERMGKNVSGAGMDPNVIGMHRRIPSMIHSTPHIERIVALDLTDESAGNAEGVGLADIITRRLHEKINLTVTYRNCITSGFLRGGMIPMTMASDQEAVALALSGLAAEQARVARIRDTGNVVRLDVSAALLDQLTRGGSSQAVEPLGALQFDAAGTLLSTGL
ncbi:MAG: lactate racemase domain-containing protein [Candidatus Bipolaricaulota bacterium]|nr:lactate racemase domain-containing protein [Candidatus Bipolaricaulota bacterium]